MSATVIVERRQQAFHDEKISICFHCGLSLSDTTYPVVIGGAKHSTCCRGCQAVAETIEASGLAFYYSSRSALPQSPREASSPIPAELAAYDLAEVQRNFVRILDGNECETTLLLDGVTCSACLWLVEQRLQQLPGVLDASVNHATRRVLVRWQAQTATLSAILGAISRLGYHAEPYDSARSEAALQKERRSMLWRLFVAAFGMMQVMMYAVPAYIAEGTMEPDHERLMQFASLLLTIPVMFWSAMPFYRGAWRSLKNRHLGMDVPVSLGIVTGFAASVLAFVQGSGTVYFDSVTMFVFLLLGARYLEMAMRMKVAHAQDGLLRLIPAIADRMDAGTLTSVATALLRQGDTVIVRPGMAVPADGVVVAGASSVNESLLTGEPLPVSKHIGDRLTAGSVNFDNVLTMRVVAVGQHTVVSGILRLMDRAAAQKPRIAVLADRAAGYFVGALLVVTVLASVGWYVIDPSRALWVCVALLLVTCPCALSLATPAVLAAATGALYRKGVLIGQGHALETLASATHFVFDKTGTLTEGKMSLVGVMPLREIGRDECVELAAALEATSEHPIGRAIAANTQRERTVATDVINTPGCGIQGKIDQSLIRVGTPEFVAQLHGKAIPSEMLFVSDDVTAVALGDAKGWIALFTLGDALRVESRRVLQALITGEKQVHILSGDRQSCVTRTAEKLGVLHARGDVTPAEKLDYVRTLQRSGAVVVTIGDGVNDAPILAQAQVSVAMGSGTDLAQASADMVLLSPKLDALLDAVRVAQRAMRVVRQNYVWTIAYNLLVVPLAVLGLVTPLMAAVGMSLSSLIVIGNASRLLRDSIDQPLIMPFLRRCVN